MTKATSTLSSAKDIDVSHALSTTEHRTAYVPARVITASERIALVSGDEVLTYAELDSRANRIAHRLRDLSVGRDTLVGFCLERSPNWIVSAFGILKAGAAYLPLDPGYPLERLKFMLDDSHAAILLTQQRLSERLRGDWQSLDVDDLLASDDRVTWTDRAAIGGDDLAYVIYTSGSTGRPKGVPITHESLLNLVLWHQETFGVTPSDRATQLASPAFDAAVWELWPYLTAGATVYMPGVLERSEPESLRDYLVSKRITISFVPTSLAEQLITLKWPLDTTLRILLTGADTLHTYPPRTLPFTFVNNYGPTECTVVASSGPVIPEESVKELPSIGRPIANTQIYILNEAMQQVQTGVAGEIHIGGVGVAHGYLNRPELTTERFIPNPFSSAPNAKLFRTGDLGRYRADGQIAFIGRTDDQVKIQGYRIELNETNTLLNRHPMLQSSLVVAREDSSGGKRLVAYIVPKRGMQPTDRDLRSFLKDQLPDFMVPALFVRLDSIPLNASGKIERSALPAPSEKNILRDNDYVVARTPNEQAVISILAKLLDLKQLSANDNFFMMGGNSLLGAQVIAKVRDRFGVELSLLNLFDHPTASELSAEIDRLFVVRLSEMSEEEATRLVASLSRDTEI